MKQRWFSLFLVLAGLALLTACTVAPSAVPLPTATPTTPDYSSFANDWKSYTNEEFQFTFEYPALYDEIEACRLSVSKEDNGGDDVNLGTRVSVSAWKDAATSVNDFLDKVIKEQEFTVETREDVKVGGADAVHISYRYGGMGRLGDAVALKRGEILYAFQWTVPTICDYADAQIDEQGAYQHVMDTFRFTQ
jgi:hypothetical protein